MPELGALAAGIAALLVIFAWSLIFSRALQAVRPHVPGLFGPLFDAVQGADNAIYNALRKWADPAVQPLTDLFNRVIATADALIVNPLVFARAVYAATWRLFSVEIPFAITTAATNARILFDDATAQAQALSNGLRDRLGALEAAAQAALGALYSDLVSLQQWALGLFQAAERDLAATAQRLESEAAAAVQQEAIRAGQVEQAIVDGVNAEARQVIGEVQAFGDALVGFVDGRLVELAGEIRGGLQLEHDFAVQVGKAAEQGLSDLEAAVPWQLMDTLVKTGEGLAAVADEDALSAGLGFARSQIDAAGELAVKFGGLFKAAEDALGVKP